MISSGTVVIPRSRNLAAVARSFSSSADMPISAPTRPARISMALSSTSSSRSCAAGGAGAGAGARSVALRGDPESLETSEHERARHPLVVALGDIGEAENAAPVHDEQASAPPYPADAALDEPERCEGVRGRVGHAQCERLGLERLRDGGLRRCHDHELGARAAEAASELAEHVEARAGLGLGLEQGQYNGCAGGKRAEIDGRAAGGGQAKRFERCIKLRHPSRPGHRRPEARRSAPAARRRSTRSDGRRR